jgi:hypothetical protein
MAAIIAGATYGEQTTISTTHPVVVPAGTKAGDLMIMQFIRDGSGWTDQTLDWTLIAFSDFSSVYLNVAAIILEAPLENFNFLSAFSRKSVHRLFHITGAHNATLPESTANSGNGGDENPPLHTLSAWGDSEETLWLAMVAWDGGHTATGYPTNYDDDRFTDSHASNSGLGVASRTLAAASENPSTFAGTGADQWCAATVGIRPAGADGGGASLISYPASYSPSYSAARVPTGRR